MRNIPAIAIVVFMICPVVIPGCGGGSSQDLYVYEELETASGRDDPSERIERLKIFASNHPDHMARTIAFGRIFEAMYRDLGDRAGAMSWFEETLAGEEDPFVRGDLLYRKFALLWEEDRDGAVSLADSIVGSGEEDYRAHLYMCYYLMGEEGREGLAERLFEKLLTLTDDPYRLAHARSVYGEFLMSSGRVEDAVRVLSLARSYPFAGEILAGSHMETGEEAEAVRDLLNYVAGAPGARDRVRIDSLYAAVHPGRDDLDAKILDRRILDGRVLPDESFSDLRGKTHRLSSYRGTPLVISAWSPT